MQALALGPDDHVLAAARALPDHASFRHFFAKADRGDNIALYHRYVAPALDRTSRTYWEHRNLRGCRTGFAVGFIAGCTHFRSSHGHGSIPRWPGLPQPESCR